MGNQGGQLPTRDAPGHQTMIERQREDLTERLNEAFATSLVDATDYSLLLDRVFGASSRTELTLIAADVPHPALTARQDSRPHPTTPDWRVRLMSWLALTGTTGLLIYFFAFILLNAS